MDLPPSHDPSAAKADLRDVAQPQLTLLIVDDQEAVRDSLKHLLERSGYRVLIADSGASAALLSASESIDCALLDVYLKDETGFSCLKLIRQNRSESSPPLRVWFMAGAVSEEIRRAAASAGALGLLAKPFERGELLATITAGLALPIPEIAS